MFRTALKNLAARKLRLVSTSVAVFLGVAFMAGTLILTDTLSRTFDKVFADVNAGVDAYVRSDETVGDGMAGHRGRIDAELVGTIAAVDGVGAAEATVQGYAQVLDIDGEPIGTTSNGPPTYGGNWIANDTLNPFTLTDGRPPTAAGEVVIDRATASVGDLAIGDRTGVLTAAGRTDVEVVGLVGFGGADSPAGASYVMFDLATAQALIAAPGQIDGIRVAAAAGVSEQQVADRIATVIVDDVEVLTGTALTAEEQDSVTEGLSFFTTFLVTFALVALFVGSFIIYNTFSILVAQRARETALLRAIGASRRQVLGAVLGEAVAVGVLAAVAGIVAGIGVAHGLKAMFDAMGVDLPAGGLVVSTSTIVTSVITGIAVSVAAAVLPARRASRIAPMAAMRDVAAPKTGSRWRVVAGVAVAVLGAGLMAVGLFGDAGIPSVGFGAAIVFVAVAVLGPSIARPVTRILGTPVAALHGVPGGIARENALRNPRRTSATAAALMVGVALVGAMTVLAASAKVSVANAIDEAFSGDVVVDSGSTGVGGFDPALAAKVAELPQIDAVTGVRVTTAEIGDDAEQVYGVDATAVDRVFDLGHVDGSLADLGTDQIAVSAATAEDDDLVVGDTIAVRFAETGAHELHVAAIYERDDAAGSYVLGLPAYEANVADQLDARIFAVAADGVSLVDAKAAVVEAARDHPQATVQDREEFAAATGEHIDQMLNLVYALLVLAIVIAFIGIANTLALSIIERTRELGLLRAVGMTRTQLRAMVRWESVLVALLGTALGLTIGTGFGWALVRALEGEGVDVFVVPVVNLVTIAALASLAGIIAAVLPARRAARLDVLQAITAT